MSQHFVYGDCHVRPLQNAREYRAQIKYDVTGAQQYDRTADALVFYTAEHQLCHIRDTYRLYIYRGFTVFKLEL